MTVESWSSGFQIISTSHDSTEPGSLLFALALDTSLPFLDYDDYHRWPAKQNQILTTATISRH